MYTYHLLRTIRKITSNERENAWKPFFVTSLLDRYSTTFVYILELWPPMSCNFHYPYLPYVYKTPQDLNHVSFIYILRI